MNLRKYRDHSLTISAKTEPALYKGAKAMTATCVRKYQGRLFFQWNSTVGSAALVLISAFTLSACGNRAASITGNWTCGSNNYVFTSSGWSSPGTASHDLPFKIDGDYIYMQTLANESVPMLRIKDSTVYENNDGIPGIGPWASPCKKAP